MSLIHVNGYDARAGGWIPNTGTTWAAVATDDGDTTYVALTGNTVERTDFTLDANLDHTLNPATAYPVNFKVRRVGTVAAGTVIKLVLIADDGSYIYVRTTPGTDDIDCAAFPTSWTTLTAIAPAAFGSPGAVTPNPRLWMYYFPPGGGNAGSVQVTYLSVGYEPSTITASAGAHGSISPSGAASVAHGADQTFTFTPDTGYRVATVTVDGADAGTGSSYTFTAVTADHTIDVTFELDVAVAADVTDATLIRLRSPRRQARIISSPGVEELTFASYETAQGAGVMGAPVECYKFVQGDNVWRFTSADREVTLADGVFIPTALTRDSLDFSQEETALNLSIKVPKSNPVAQLFIGFNPPTPVTVTVWRKHRSNPAEVLLFALGRVVTVSFDGPEATLLCAPISQMFRRRVPSLVFQSHCNWALYGTGCGVTRASFKDTVTVIGVTGPTVSFSSARPDGWFTNGWLENADGVRQFIVDHAGGTVTLQFAMPGLRPGDAVDLYAGCDRTEATCAGKFNNLVRHLGFPRVPSRNPYNGSLV
jgi:uncharacterized phage protein (TIGR02218 family)